MTLGLYANKTPNLIDFKAATLRCLYPPKSYKQIVPRLNKNAYAYTSLIKCGKCGCAVAGKTNEKYVHYFCIRKSDKRPCDQTKYTSVEALEEEIENELTKYEILPEFRDLAIDILKRNNTLEVGDREAIYKTQQKARHDTQAKLDGLVDMRLKGQLDDADYDRQRERYKREISGIDELLRGTEKRSDSWLELTEQAFNFATYARHHLTRNLPLNPLSGLCR